MQKADSLQGKLSHLVFFLTALLVVAADQLSKLWIRSNLARGESLPEAGAFRLIYVQNSGAAFGLFQDQSFPLTIVALIGVAVLLVFVIFIYHRLPFLDSWLGKPALGLVLGGTIGNLVDRLRLGYITDFIGIGIWPTFNIADSAIVVGVMLFAYCLRSLTGAKKTNLSA
ncbi:MAG: lipoprotein signal peptidase [Dehalococcoidia bacterium]|nr:lipoprotein signal peptidase [Dehalococcoidia bacterium]